MIVIINYGMGNLHSVLKAFKRLRVDAIISSNPEDIQKAEKLILPGVGHFKRGMKNLSELGLINLLNEVVVEKEIPILGICLGMQLFTKHSEEGDVDGLGWLDATTVKFNFDKEFSHLRIPHIGWNTLQLANNSSLFTGIENDASFYFVHSYHVVCENSEDIAATTEYGHEIVSSIRKNNIFATQFHPEKSHDAGLLMLKNFVENV